MTETRQLTGSTRVNVRTQGRITLGLVAIALLLVQWPLTLWLRDLRWFGDANDDVWDSIARGVVVFGSLLLAHAITGFGIWPRRWKDVSRLGLAGGMAIIVGIIVVSQFSWVQFPTFFGLSATGRIDDPVVSIGAALMASAVPASRWRPKPTWITFALSLAIALVLALLVDHLMPTEFKDPDLVAFVYNLAFGFTLIAASLLADGALGLRWEPEWMALVMVAFVVSAIVVRSLWGFDSPVALVMDKGSEIGGVAFAALVVGFWRGSMRTPELSQPTTSPA